VTMAIRPSGGHETALFIILIYRINKRNIFAAGAGHDFTDLPDGTICL
jgi:hypothetical protein